MLKKIARRILKNEIEKLKQENEIRSKEHWDLINEHAEKEHELTKQIESIKEKLKTIEEASKNLSAENEIMRKYYRLDSEPTDEEKIKGGLDMDLDCSRYFPLSKKLFYKKLKHYSGIFECSRKGYRKSRYLKWKKRVMKRSASTIIGQKVKKRKWH